MSYVETYVYVQVEGRGWYRRKVSEAREVTQAIVRRATGQAPRVPVPNCRTIKVKLRIPKTLLAPSAVAIVVDVPDDDPASATAELA